MNVVFYISLAAIVGAAAAWQALINSSLNKTADLPLTSLVVNLVAAATALVIYLLFSRQNLDVLRNADWYAFTGGILGVVVVMGSMYLIPRLGVTITTSIIIVSQLIVAMVADHFGILGIRVIPIEPVRLAALLLMIVGIYLFFR